jgi:hypothetical protein
MQKKENNAISKGQQKEMVQENIKLNCIVILEGEYIFPNCRTVDAEYK